MLMTSFQFTFIMIVPRPLITYDLIQMAPRQPLKLVQLKTAS